VGQVVAVFDERIPIYQQIADKIKEDILTGALGEDEQVMSTNQYAAFYRINPATAAKGFHQLLDEGILYKRRGIGMFVSADARGRLRAQRRERFFDGVVEPMVAQAKVLDISLTEVVSYIERLGGQP
jgi:DNA-binding transcriptional regulator YhcF (GntR family)